jgi:hypothetical protein
VCDWPHNQGDGKPAIELAPLRDGYFNHTEHKRLVDQLPSRQAKEELQALGLAHRYSPFWALKWVRKDFYMCFGICDLHLHFLGLMKVYNSTSPNEPHLLTTNCSTAATSALSNGQDGPKQSEIAQ